MRGLFNRGDGRRASSSKDRPSVAFITPPKDPCRHAFGQMLSALFRRTLAKPKTSRCRISDRAHAACQRKGSMASMNQQVQACHRKFCGFRIGRSNGKHGAGNLRREGKAVTRTLFGAQSPVRVDAQRCQRSPFLRFPANLPLGVAIRCAGRGSYWRGPPPRRSQGVRVALSS